MDKFTITNETGAQTAAAVAATFVHPCLVCGRTVHVVDSVEQPHHCSGAEPDPQRAALAALAWWAGHDHADAETEKWRSAYLELRQRVIRNASEIEAHAASLRHVTQFPPGPVD